MADATDRGKAWIPWAAFVVVAMAIGVSYFRSRPARKPIGVIASQIEQGDELQKMLAIHAFYGDLSGPDEFAQVFPQLIRAMKDESAMVRDAAASAAGDLIFRFGSHKPVTDQRNPTIVALCPRAEEALAVLLDESPPTRGCDLRLMSPVTDVTGIPTAGKGLIIVAAVDHRIHFRVFDGDGKMVVDTDQTRLMELASQIETLRKRLESLWPPHELTRGEKDEVIAALTPIVDRIPGLRAGRRSPWAMWPTPASSTLHHLDWSRAWTTRTHRFEIEAANALIWYRQGPELLVPVALRRLPGETPGVRGAFTDVFWFVRLEPSVLPVLIEGLSSENTEVRLCCTAAINHMGRDARPALPDILTLIRKELATPPRLGADLRERIIAMASGAIGELSPDTEPQPGTVELLCEVLKRPTEAGPGSDSDRPAGPIAPAEALKSQVEFRQAEAVWSLGILGRSAASAVPLLLSMFEAAPQASTDLRQLLAESLAEISRGTPDADRVIASLAKAWKTASKPEKTAFARALRSLGPKSEQLVPELAQMPRDDTRSRIRRVRYPRSRRGVPARESSAPESAVRVADHRAMASSKSWSFNS